MERKAPVMSPVMATLPISSEQVSKPLVNPCYFRALSCFCVWVYDSIILTAWGGVASVVVNHDDKAGRSCESWRCCSVDPVYKILLPQIYRCEKLTTPRLCCCPGCPRSLGSWTSSSSHPHPDHWSHKFVTTRGAPFQYPIRRLIVISREVSKLQDW